MPKMWNEMDVHELSEDAERYIHTALLRGEFRMGVKEIVIQAFTNGREAQRKAQEAEKKAKRKKK